MNDPAPNDVAFKQPHFFRALLQLVRFPAVFTVIADVMMGFLLTSPTLIAAPFFKLLAASVCFYWAGMVLNDVFDAKQDAEQRPHRPIPSGRISARLAAAIGVGLLIAGIAISWTIGLASLRLGLLLALAIVLYDAVLKQTPLAPIAMGACRFFNILLAASYPLQWDSVWGLPQLQVAAGFGIYIVGITIFARSEATLKPNRRLLYSGTIVIFSGLAILGHFTSFEPGFNHLQVGILLALIAAGLLVRLGNAIRSGLPISIQMAIKSLLMTIITLDAILIYFKTDEPAYAITCMLLILPAIFLARKIAVT